VNLSKHILDYRKKQTLFFCLFLLQRNFFQLRQRHQTSATKLRYLQSSAFYRQPEGRCVI